MGISLNPLVYISSLKPTLGRTLVFGRQQMNLREKDQPLIDNVLENHGYSVRYSDLHKEFFAEKFFQMLGATQISWLDASNYEGADIVHDLNVPVSEDLKANFDTVMDLGTLEHILFPPHGFLNAAKLLKPGGLFIGFSPANNWLGHGFYQFSPELFWSVLPSVGFDVREVSLMMRDGSGKIHRLPNPREDGRRYEIRIPSGWRTDICCMAVRNRSDAPEVLQVTQSDYEIAWAQKL